MSLQELQSLTQDAIVELFEVDISSNSVNETLRFCNSQQTDDRPIVFDGKLYQAWPIEAEGFEISSQGSLPEPVISISNYQSALSALLLAYKPAGAKVTRRRIFAKHLDSGSSPNPAAEFPPDIFILDSWQENQLFCRFRLITELEYLRINIPRRRVVALRYGEES